MVKYEFLSGGGPEFAAFGEDLKGPARTAELQPWFPRAPNPSPEKRELHSLKRALFAPMQMVIFTHIRVNPPPRSPESSAPPPKAHKHVQKVGRPLKT